MSTHTTPDDLLADYAAGTTTPGVTLLVAAHLTQVPGSRDRVDVLESVGGTLFADEQSVELSSDALSSTLALLDTEPEVVSNTLSAPHGPIPGVVLDALGTDFDAIPWRFRLPGVSAAEFDGFGDEHVSLLRARPGSTVPQHTHQGQEMTLVLQGCLSDGGVEYRKGDIAINDEHDDHSPKVIGDEICYCLIVQNGDLRFTGRLGRVLNFLGE